MLKETTTNRSIGPEVNIPTSRQGFYKGLNPTITIISKVIIVMLVLFAIVMPSKAASTLGSINTALLAMFNSYYIISVSLFLIFCLAMALSPFGKLRLGQEHERPEFSNFSWFAMMFGAGMGIGLMFYSIGEPMYHFAGNPDVIKGMVSAKTADTVPSSIRYSFLHWGLHAWGIYVSIGLAMAYFAYRQQLPLTVRSALIPLFGDRLNGSLGHAIDIIAVVATVLGISTTVGTGVLQLISGFESVTGAAWLLNGEGKPTGSAMVFALLLVMGLSTLSAMTGVGKGVKWLSNVNLALSFVLLTVFALFGSTAFAFSTYVSSLADYLIALPAMSFTVWDQASELGQWQGGWTIYYWAWWIAFAPFVGLFLARISRGRTIREFIIGAMIIPTLMCCLWFALLGGTALDLELNGGANGSIVGSVIESQMFVTLQQMLPANAALGMSLMVILLILTYLVTSADSGVLVLNTIMAGGNDQPGASHRVVWGTILTLVVGSLMFAGGLEAIQKAMVIGALPFSVIMILMCAGTLKSALSKQQTANAENNAA
ncbi:BCCT family transporter [Oceanimonas doudoroffii]|uniref:Transporter n=1 Tax=Oceanimonas doudoroffii TaxID=84158 RepID=G5CZE8_9GAMM|nr:BCCT family transporter [Oceanimonas doudoroffii]AEQ39127.1 BCCT family betaine/choline/carnitine transporter [Oceanimonas doudoroffii]OXY83445.1 transporter [Oceanimonas doudoroffii]